MATTCNAVNDAYMVCVEQEKLGTHCTKKSKHRGQRGSAVTEGRSGCFGSRSARAGPRAPPAPDLRGGYSGEFTLIVH